MLKKAKMSNFFKTRKIMVFEILTFDLYPEEKRQLCKLLFYMNASTS